MKLAVVMLVEGDNDLDESEIEEGVQDIVMECTGVTDATTRVIAAPADLTIGKLNEIVTGIAD